MSDTNILNLVLTGTDEPGITSRLMGVLQTFDVEILDILTSQYDFPLFLINILVSDTLWKIFGSVDFFRK